MARRICMINDITPNTPKGWKVKITVLEKLIPRGPTPTSPHKFQKLIFSDSTGTRVQATMFNNDIDLLENTLLPFRKYFIADAQVKHSPIKYRLVPNEYQWTISSRCLIEEVDDDASPVSLNFIPISEIFRHRDTSHAIDVLAIALQLLPERKQKTCNGPARIQEIIVTDSSLKPVLLTLWNQSIDNEGVSLAPVIVEKPVIAAMRVNVVSYHGDTLSFKKSSSILIRPQVPEAINLQEWYIANKNLIDSLMNSAPYLALAHRFDAQSLTDITPIKALDSASDNTFFTLKCSLSVVDMHQKFYYMGCSSCSKITSAQYQESFTCNKCKMKNMHGVPICCVNVEAADSTGMINAVLFEDDAEQFLSCTALMIMQNQNQPIESLIKLRTEGEILVRVKAKESKFQGPTSKKFIITMLMNVHETPQLQGGADLEKVASTKKDTSIYDDSLAPKVSTHAQQTLQHVEQDLEKKEGIPKSKNQQKSEPSTKIKRQLM